MSEKSTVVIGGGPAGLTAAYILSKDGIPVHVIEADPQNIGGIARTISHNGYLFDVGPHRFFSKSDEINALWSEILPEGFHTRSRQSRIFYKNRFFSYPLRPFEALVRLGPVEAVRCVLSFVRARIWPHRNPDNFQDWVSNQFGARLFNIFFRTYTEKVWGMDCRKLSADWAGQRIKGLSLGGALVTAFGLDRLFGRARPKSLVDSFRFPEKGTGMMWTACAAKIQGMGGRVSMGRRVVSCRFDESSGDWIVRHRGLAGDEIEDRARHVISSAPLGAVAGLLQPPMPEEARQAAATLSYRDLIVVHLVLDRRLAIDDHWIYLHDPAVRAGRLQNYAAWSPAMLPNDSTTSLGIEYFCFNSEPIWKMKNDEILELAKADLRKIGLAGTANVIDFNVVRQPKAYPVYDDNYHRAVDLIRKAFVGYPRFSTVGRNAMHKYNNQDHSMMAGILAARNIVAGRETADPWRVNIDAEYHEESSAPDANPA